MGGLPPPLAGVLREAKGEGTAGRTRAAVTRSRTGSRSCEDEGHCKKGLGGGIRCWSCVLGNLKDMISIISNIYFFI